MQKKYTHRLSKWGLVTAVCCLPFAGYAHRYRPVTRARAAHSAPAFSPTTNYLNRSLKFRAEEANALSARPVEATLTGKVTGTNGDALPGVTVLLKGTTTGTTTGPDGTYHLVLAENSGTLVFSFIGYLSQERTFNGSGTINVALSEDAEVLNEVVVVGYGTQERKEVVGAVGVAGRKDFGEVAVSSPTQLIQGKLAGVQVVNNNGVPGSGANIIIRGTGSFTNNSPLYVIDGIQSDAGTFNSISPYDIQDITVLKDASSVAIYGAQGANGVVIVTTRRAKTGAPRVTYNGYYGLAQAWKQLDILDAGQYVAFVKEFAANQPNVTLPEKLNSADVLVNRTDWQDEIFRTAKLTEHHVSLSGGTDKVTYDISAGYTNQESIQIGYNFKRFNLRLNLEEQIGKRFRLGQSLNIRYAVNKGALPSFTDALRMPPYAPVYDPTNLGGFSKVTTINDLNDAFNPLTNVYLRDQQSRNLLNYGQFFGEVRLFDGLKFRSQIGLNFNTFSNYNFIEANLNGNLNNPNNITENYGWGLSPVFENYFSYNRDFGVHRLGLTLGNTYRATGTSRGVTVGGSDFPNNEIHQIGVAGKNSVTSAYANSGGTLISYFARVNYTLRDRYIFSASARRDGASVFGPNNRYGNFPSVGIGWRVSEEDFMKNIPFLSELKLRASWGKTGNSNIGAYLYQANVFKGVGNNIVYAFGLDKALLQGSTISAAVNPNLKWEETAQTDVGFDLGLWNNQLTLSGSYYQRKNKDLLVYKPIPLSTGIGGTGYIGTNVATNAASAFNKGFELSATYNGNAGDFRYSVSANVAYNKNRVTALGEGAGAIVSGGVEAISAFTRTDIGQPIGSFYGYVMDHVAVNQEEVNRYTAAAQAAAGGNTAVVYQESLLPGDIIFQDLDGDGRITEKDQTYIGNPNPKWNYGSNINLAFKNFDFMVAFTGVAGVDIVNGLKYWTEGMTRPFNASTAILNRWQQPGDVTNIPRAGQNATANLNLRQSDRFVENGAYLRVRNVTLGYTLPEAALKSVTGTVLSSLRVYLTAQNLFTFTNYSGYDPEVSAQDPNNAGSYIFARGIDQGQYPQPRTFMLGVNVGF